MENLEKIVSTNITELRKLHKLTQAELAEKINYSDKSVSKWERGEALPDLKVLKNMSELFGVSIDYFVNENATNETDKYMPDKTETGYRSAVMLLACMILWFVSTIFYVYLKVARDVNMWMIFIWAIPLTFVIFYRYDRKWFRLKYEVFIASAFCWSLLTAMFLHCLIFFSMNIWMLYLVGVPAQIMIVLMHMIRVRKR